MIKNNYNELHIQVFYQNKPKEIKEYVMKQHKREYKYEKIKARQALRALIVRNKFKWLEASKFGNTDEMNDFLGIYKSLRPIQEKAEN